MEFDRVALLSYISYPYSSFVLQQLTQMQHSCHSHPPLCEVLSTAIATLTQCEQSSFAPSFTPSDADCLRSSVTSLFASIPPQSFDQLQFSRFVYTSLSLAVNSTAVFRHPASYSYSFSMDVLFMYFVRVFNSDEVLFLVVQIMYSSPFLFTYSALGVLFILFVISREKDLQLLQILRSQQSVEAVRAIALPQQHANAKPVKLGKRGKAAKPGKGGKAKAEVSSPSGKEKPSMQRVGVKEERKEAKEANVMAVMEKTKDVKSVKKEEKGVKEEKETKEEKKETKETKKETKETKKDVEEKKEETSISMSNASEGSCGRGDSSVSLTTISSASSPPSYALVEPAATVRFLVFRMVSELQGVEFHLVTSNTEVLEGGERMTIDNGLSRCWRLHRVNGEFTTKVCVSERATEGVCKEVLLTYRYAIRLTRKYSVKWFFSEWHSQYVSLTAKASLERTVVLDLDQAVFKSYEKLAPTDADSEKTLPETALASPKSVTLSSPKSGTLSSPGSCYERESTREEGLDLSAASVDSDFGEGEVKLTPKKKSKKSKTLRILTLPGEAEWDKKEIAFGTTMDEKPPKALPHPQPPATVQPPAPIPPMTYPPVMCPPFYQPPMMMVVGPTGQPMMVSPYPQNPFFVYTAPNGGFIPEENKGNQ